MSEHDGSAEIVTDEEKLVDDDTIAEDAEETEEDEDGE